MANALLLKTEVRGEHATGFWACERGNGRVFFDKEPIKASIYASRSIWCKQFASIDCDLLIGHCRFTSLNVGHEKFNKNNHPHVSSDRRVALVHNGKIPEYNALKSKYDLRSDCDSEILLGMFESSEAYKEQEEVLKQEFPSMPYDIAYRMMGLREVFSHVNYGAMAVAIGERAENDFGRYLWLFRDEDRPLHVVDLRKTLGQIFFCSTPEIWKAASENCPGIKNYIPSNQRIIEFPSYHIWMFSAEPNENPEAVAWEQLKKLENPVTKEKYSDISEVPNQLLNTALVQSQDTWRIKKYKITKMKFYDWEPDKEEKKLPRSKNKPKFKVVTRLTGKDEELSDRNTWDEPKFASKIAGKNEELSDRNTWDEPNFTSKIDSDLKLELSNRNTGDELKSKERIGSAFPVVYSGAKLNSDPKLDIPPPGGFFKMTQKGELSFCAKLPSYGEYVVRVHAYAESTDVQLVHMSLRMDDKELINFGLNGTGQNNIREHKFIASAGEHKFAVAFVNPNKCNALYVSSMEIQQCVSAKVIPIHKELPRHAYSAEDDTEIEDVPAKVAASNVDEAISELNGTVPDSEINMTDFENIVNEIKEEIAKIYTDVKNREKEKSLGVKEFDVIMNSLKDVKAELQGSLIFLE